MESNRFANYSIDLINSSKMVEREQKMVKGSAGNGCSCRNKIGGPEPLRLRENGGGRHQILKSQMIGERSTRN
jgi:hypothetical protein